jgi:hypothetical protein
VRKRDGRKKCADGFYIQLDWFLLCPPRIHLGLFKETLLHNPAIDIKEDPFAPPRESLAYLKSQWKLSLSLSLYSITEFFQQSLFPSSSGSMNNIFSL